MNFKPTKTKMIVSLIIGLIFLVVSYFLYDVSPFNWSLFFILILVSLIIEGVIFFISYSIYSLFDNQNNNKYYWKFLNIVILVFAVVLLTTGVLLFSAIINM